MASSPDQSNELSVLDGDDGNVSPDSQNNSRDWLYNYSILIVWSCHNVQLHMSKV